MLFNHWKQLDAMGRTWSVYISDDELNRRIEEELDANEFHNQAHLFTEAVRELLDTDELDELT